MLKPLNVPHSQGEKSTRLLARLTQLVLTLTIGSFACIALLLLFTTKAQSVQAAPLPRSLAEIITDTVKVTHTPTTTHEMSVFANGRITDQFCNDDPGGTNQINTDNITGTTIAVMFDQHTDDNVDVGSQGEFTPTTPITLNTSSDIPGYSEDSYVVYASGVLSYQITQRTLATDTNNCVIMELVIRNTGIVTPLTGGKLLYMVDINVADHPEGDRGVYDSARRLVYLKDEDGSYTTGYAMGVSLLEGDLRGYGIVTDDDLNYPDPLDDANIRDELITPTNAITDGLNGVVWLVANIPDLNPGQEAPFAFGLCASTVSGAENLADNAADNVVDSFDKVTKLSVSKTATPTASSSVVAGEPITYSIAISNTGYRYVNNIVVTDTVPASTDLITYSVSQGSITASNRLITATIGRLYPTSGTVTVALVVAPSITSTNGTVISNQAFIKSEPIITNTNIITHHIINAPALMVTKRADPEPVVSAGEVLSYTIVISRGGQGYATGVTVSDTLPANTQFVSNSIALDPPSVGTGTEPPILASDVVITAGQSVTVTFAVTVTKPLTNGTIITNTVAVTCTQVPTPTTSMITSTVTTTPAVNIVKSGPNTANVGDTVVFTFTVTNVGNTLLQNVVVEDDYAAAANYVYGDNSDGWLDLTEAWVYTASYTIPPTTTDPLTNTATVTATDVLSATEATDTDTHTTTLSGFAPTLTITKTGPATANVGDTTVFTFTISHAAGSDGSPVTTLSVTDTIASPAYYVSGDSNSNDKLDATETWTYTASHTIQPTDTNPLVNTVTVKGQDPEDDPITATDSHTTTLSGFAPTLTITKTGPTTANVGDTTVFTFTISHAAGSDGSPVTTLSVTDTIASPVYYVSGDSNSNDKLDATETWTYTASHTIQLTDPDPLVNVGTATALDEDNDALPVVTATHSTAIEYAPALTITKTGPTTANVGDTVVFTFTVGHDTILSDRSLIANVTVTDDRAGSAAYVNGDDGDDELEWGESWIYTASYTTQRTDDKLLMNTGTVQGKDREGDNVTATDTHTTTLSGFDPALNIIKQGSTTAKVGDTVVFTFTVTNVSFTPTSIKASANGDGSPISNVTVTDDFAGVASYVRGDDGDGLLRIGETWVYTASYTVQTTDPNPLVNTGMVTGEDGDGDPINDTDTHSTTIDGRTNFIFLPIVLKDY